MPATVQVIFDHFPELSPTQKEQFEALGTLYPEWNKKINVISRKDIDELYTRHILHSLAIAKFKSFDPGTEVLDIGTGGGFPGIPLAILFPESKFYLVDSIGKKIKVVQSIADSIGLKNLKADHQRAEKVKGKVDFIVSRAVAKTKVIRNWTRKLLNDNPKQETGYLLLKGGDLEEELAELGRPHSIKDLSDYFDDPFFQTKKIVYIGSSVRLG